MKSGTIHFSFSTQTPALTLSDTYCKKELKKYKTYFLNKVKEYNYVNSFGI